MTKEELREGFKKEAGCSISTRKNIIEYVEWLEKRIGCTCQKCSEETWSSHKNTRERGSEMTTSMVTIGNKTHFHAETPAEHAPLFAQMVENAVKTFCLRVNRRFSWQWYHQLTRNSIDGFINFFAGEQHKNNCGTNVVFEAYITLNASLVNDGRLCVYVELTSDPKSKSEKKFETKVEL